MKKKRDPYLASILHTAEVLNEIQFNCLRTEIKILKWRIERLENPIRTFITESDECNNARTKTNPFRGLNAAINKTRQGLKK